MSGISGVSGSYNAYSNYSAALSSGKKINSAADGASELAIMQKQERETRSYDVGTENLQQGQSAVNIADGAMSGIVDHLQRIRELGVKASNGLYTAEDKQYMQKEIDQLKQGISDIAGTAGYNGLNLLDGKQGDKISIVSDADGNAMDMSLANGTLEALGIADFDVTGDFDLSSIDNAIDKLSANRSTLGSQSNAFDFAISYNRTASYNTTESQSRIGDTEYGEYVNKLQKENILNTYQIMMQKKQQEQKSQATLGLFT